MIDKFTWLSNEDKADVVKNIDNYSLKEIEAELSILCVRNKVDFKLNDESNSNSEKKPPIVFNLENNEDSAPAWIQAVRET